MRHMAGDREHQVMVRRAHGLDIRPDRFPKRPHLGDRFRVRALGRRENGPAIDEQRGKARVRAGLLGPRDRMRRDQPGMRRQNRARAPRSPRALTEPTSDTIAPGFSAGAIARPISPFAPTGAHRMTQSASRTASARSRRVDVAQTESLGAGQSASGEASATTIRRAAFCLRMARASDEPISPMPMIARSPNTGSSSGGPSRSAMTASSRTRSAPRRRPGSLPRRRPSTAGTPAARRR